MAPPKYISTDPSAGTPVGQYLSTDPNAGTAIGTPIQSKATIGPQQRPGIGEQIASFARPVVGPIANNSVGLLPFIGKYFQTNPNPAPGTLASDIENYTQQGRAQHPFLARIGDMMRGTQGLLNVAAPEASMLGMGPLGPGLKEGAAVPAQPAPQAEGALPFLRRTVGNWARDPVTGKLRPSVVAGSHAAGAALGYEAGKESGHGMEGILLGGFMGPEVADAAIPASQNAAYEARAAAIMRRGQQEERLARQAAQNAPPPELGTPENPGFYAKIPVRMPKATVEPSPIISPTQGEPSFSGSEGRAATWTNQDVMRLASQGNRDAIQQAVRRGLPLPENARYVMGDADYPRAVYNPRETTRFEPENAPVRNKANPTQKTSPKKILPWMP